MSQQRAFLVALGAVAGAAFFIGRASSPQEAINEVASPQAVAASVEQRAAPRGFEPAPVRGRLASPAKSGHEHPGTSHPAVDEQVDAPGQPVSLREFRTTRDPKRLAALTASLGKLRDPKVEALALRIARHGTDPARRRAAFEVLDRIDSPQARPVALEVLSRESDRDLRRAALFAIDPPRGVSVREAAPVVQALARILSSDPDPLLRRRAAVSLGRWHRTVDDLQPLISGLARDTSINVRAGCAFGLEVAGRRDAAIASALVTSLGTQQEDPLVRENAWKALSALGPLSIAAHAAWKAFKAERDAQGEAN